MLSLLVLGTLLINLSAAVLITKPVYAPADWWNTSWQYRKEIAVDSTKVDADLTAFPVLINVTDGDLALKAQDDGDDIAFTNEAGVQLSHEIESYDNSAGHLVAWVNANLSSTIDTVLYMYYGNAGAFNQEDAAGVWDSNYMMVQHLEETTLSETSPLPWDKYEGNPILNGSQNGFASVFYDGDTSLYHLFCSWGSVLHFTSTDGKTGWLADPENPVLSGNGEGVPMVWKEDGWWYMLYRYGGPNAIGLANSTDATHWTRYEGNPVLQFSPPSFIDPWGVIKVGSTYYLWFNDGFGTGGRAVGLATSTDLKSWTQDPANPIFMSGRYCTFPFKYDGYYYMLVPLYTYADYGVIELYRDVDPTFYPSSREYLGVTVGPGPEGEWDDRRFDTPCVLTDTIYRDTYLASNNELWMYYAATGTPTGSGADWWTGMTIETNITEALPDPVDTTCYDSTSNDNDGLVIGSLDLNAIGQIDGADDFDGADTYIDCGDSESLKGMDTLTLEAWFKPEAWNNGVVSKWGGWTPGTGGSWIMFQGSSGNIGWGVVTETSWASLSGSTLPTGAWYHLVGVYDGSQIRMYVNGVPDGTPQAVSGRIASTDHPAYIGRYTSVRTTGIIDEVRVSNVSRSPEWISTEFNNQHDPSSFMTVGGEEAAPAGPNTPPIASDLAITPSMPSTTDDLVGSYTYFDADGDPESGTEIRWYKDAVLQPAYNDTLTISASSTAPGEEWFFTVRPSDGEDFGTLQTAPSVTITEEAPETRTFGKTNQGARQWRLFPWYEKVACRFEAPEEGDIFAITAYCQARASGMQFRTVIYSDNAGAPNALLAYGDLAALSETAGWQSAPVSLPITGSTHYWIGLQYAGRGGCNLWYDPGTSGQTAENPEFGIPDNPFGAASYLDYVLSIYANYTAGAPPPPPVDTTPPTYSDVGANPTDAGHACLFSTRWSDDVELSGYVFGNNNTGTWLNSTWTPLSGVSDWSNETRVLNPTVGALVQYRFYCNDTSNNWNSTPIYSLRTRSPVEMLFSVSSNSTVSDIAFNATSKEITFTVEGSTGTTGHLNIFLSDRLISDITGLTIYFDGDEMAYTATPTEDGWTIQLTYQHSKHTVRIVLSSASPAGYGFTDVLIATAMTAVAAAAALLILYRKKRLL